jgi:hypothetical protein
MDCFAEPVIRRRFVPTGWLAMTVLGNVRSVNRQTGAAEFTSVPFIENHGDHR